MKNELLMVLATSGALVLLVLMFKFPIPQENAQIFMALMAMVFGYFFGAAINKNGRPPEGSTNETITSVTSVTTPDKPVV